MMPARRPRFSVRIGAAQDDNPGPFEGVPAHLLVPLQDWVRTVTREDDDMAQRIALRLRIPIPRHQAPWGVLAYQEGVELLDIVDELLPQSIPFFDADQARTELEELLEAAGSMYQLNEARDGLEERVTPAVRDAVHQSVADAASTPTAGSAADHLAVAWQTAYGRQPDPVRAYSETIKAVESAAQAVMTPNDAKATLGKMLGEFKSARHKFTSVLPTPTTGDPVGAAESMMRALWDGQTSRHGSQTPTVPETLESARAAVHLAAALVQWFVSGAISRTP